MNASIPLDGDADEICDLDDKILDILTTVWSRCLEAVINQPDFIILPNLTGVESGTWSIIPALPAGLEFSGSMARSGDTGIISGIPTETSPMTNYTVFATIAKRVMFNFSMAVLADTDDGLPDGPSVTGLEVDEEDDGDGLLDELEVGMAAAQVTRTMSLRLMKTASVLLRIPRLTRMMIRIQLLAMLLTALLLLLLLLFLSRRKEDYDDAEPENTAS